MEKPTSWMTKVKLDEPHSHIDITTGSEEALDSLTFSLGLETLPLGLSRCANPLQNACSSQHTGKTDVKEDTFEQKT